MSAGAPRDWQKFTADMVYGALATGSCILSGSADALKRSIVRITNRRKLFFKGKWLRSTTLRDRYKGKFKCGAHFHGKGAERWVTCVNVQVTGRTRYRFPAVQARAGCHTYPREGKHRDPGMGSHRQAKVPATALPLAVLTL